MCAEMGIRMKEKFLEKAKPFVFILPSVLVAAFSIGGFFIGSDIAAKNSLLKGSLGNDVVNEANAQENSGAYENETDKKKTAIKKTADVSVRRVKKTKIKSGKPADGVFEGSSVCEKFGYTVSLKAKFKDGEPAAVYDMKMLNNSDSSNNAYMTKAWRGMVKRIIGGNVGVNASDIDIVSGATYSSNAILNAYLDARNKAIAKADGTKIKSTPKPNVVPSKKPTAVKVPPPATVRDGDIADGKYRVSAVCEPDEDEDFEKYTLSASFTFLKGKCIDIAHFSSTAESNKNYYMKAANGDGKVKGVAAQILNKQSADGISAVSGATCSSKTIVKLYVKALEEAAKKAGVNKTPMPSESPVPTLQPENTSSPQDTQTPMPAATSDVLPSAEPTPEPSLIPLNSGTYNETITVYPNESNEFREYTLTADVLFDDNRFCGFENVTLSDETNRFYYNKAVNGTKKKPGLISQINAKQNDELDAVSGATCTSNALIELFSKAWNEAKVK